METFDKYRAFPYPCVCTHILSKQTQDSHQKETMLLSVSKAFSLEPLKQPSPIFGKTVCIYSEGQLVDNQET